MQPLKITLIQSPLYWEQPDANLAMFEEKIWTLKEKTDLIILPEMFTTGFTMNASSLAEVMNFKTFKWLKQMASQTSASITGSLIVKENEHFFNRLIWMNPDGSFFTYDKRHLFRMADEDKVFTEGKESLIVNLKGWKICPLICYDLRFPVWSRNSNNRYDILLYVANWPSARSLAWKTLLRARAIENLSYAVGLNRIGKDGKDIEYSGDSAVIDFKGEEILDLSNLDCIKTVTLEYNSLMEFREKFPANLDADNFSLTL